MHTLVFYEHLLLRIHVTKIVHGIPSVSRHSNVSAVY